MNVEPPSAETLPAGEDAYRSIKSDIVLSRIAPGAAVSEAMLEKRYSFGRASIRKALTRLAQDGLIVPRARSGHQVAPLTLADIDEVFMLRRRLEPYSVRLAAGRIDEPRLRALDQLCRASYTAGDIEGELAFLEANRQFHVALGYAAGLPRLGRMVEQLHDEAARILYLGFRLKSRSEEWSHGHEALLEALTAPDPEKAEKIATDLLDHSYEQVRKAALESRSLRGAELVAG
ncbi:GntR family transcriptional regulator [Xinfangfangia sp. CPCC 101601]|uniref:GntR family transcriptional regulator n=1 Tax=Pseudogemmobacter lacusdianii TaxID=3069608 RepID=A0ABU0VTR7_9RHOB|nr:GntR family transcriptional regulator [Xinfangfangia sp. CPCC 101601]MDQ2065121.1 GntR family transcriptional regulator [Xinfangfangia sp. CPCC 101601]